MAEATKKKIVNEEVEQLKPSELFDFLISAVTVGLVPAVWGGIGIGKSSIVRQVVQHFRENGRPEYGYIEYRTATQEPTDVTGVPMPNLKDECTDFLKPGRLKRLPDDWEGIIFLDEFTKAPPSVTNAWSQPILDRMIDDFEIPKGARFVIAGNRRQDKSSDTDLGQFMYNRIMQVELVPDVVDTTNHFRKIGVRNDLVAFLKFGGAEYLYDFNPDKKVHPTPRTWEMAGKWVDLAERDKMPDIMMQAGVTGLVGKGAAYAYTSFRKMLNNIPAASEIINDPMGAKVFTEDQSSAYALAMYLARKAEPGNMDAIMKYMARNTIEIAAAFVTEAGVRNPKIKETKAYIDWSAKHKDLALD